MGEKSAFYRKGKAQSLQVTCWKSQIIKKQSHDLNPGLSNLLAFAPFTKLPYFPPKLLFKYIKVIKSRHLRDHTIHLGHKESKQQAETGKLGSSLTRESLMNRWLQLKNYADKYIVKLQD